MKKNIIYILSTFLLGLNLFLCIGVLANDQEMTDHKIIPENINNSWSGKYRQATGVHELVIDQYESDAIAVEIVKVRDPKSHPTANFLATIKDNMAFMTLLRKEPDCRVELKRTKKGIIISNFCGGSGADAGLYIKINNNSKNKEF